MKSRLWVPSPVHSDRLYLCDGADEPEHAHVWAASRSVNGEIPQHDGVHAVQVVVGMQKGFGGALRCGIRGQRAIAQSILRYRAVFMVAVDAGRGGEDESADAELPAQLQEVESPQDIGLVA